MSHIMAGGICIKCDTLDILVILDTLDIITALHLCLSAPLRKKDLPLIQKVVKIFQSTLQIVEITVQLRIKARI